MLWEMFRFEDEIDIDGEDDEEKCRDSEPEEEDNKQKTTMMTKTLKVDENETANHHARKEDSDI
jgi:hypothetical protein